MRSSRLTMLCVLFLACGTHALATTISGQVLDHLGQPAANIDLDFVDVVTGDDASVNNATTDPMGHYTVIILPGIYDVFFTPPGGIRLAAHVEPGVDLNVDQVLDVVLEEAWFVSGQVLRGVMGQGMRLTSIGLVAGVLPAIGVGYAILSIPASIPDAGVLEFSLSPLPIAAVVLILGAVGLIASLLPARRATRIDPIVAFREE